MGKSQPCRRKVSGQVLVAEFGFYRSVAVLTMR